MAIDVFAAISGEDIFTTLTLVLLIVYFLWIYAWGKKQVGPNLGLLLAIVITFLLFYNFPDLIWIPFLLFIWAVFGKDLLERVPKTKV